MKPAKINKSLPDWELLLSAAARLQEIVPNAVLVGGTAVAMHTKHRQSQDADHVVENLRDHFDEVLADLESVAGWKTARTLKPVLILGSLDGIMTGVRQLKRTEPLETMEMVLEAKGQRVVFPTAGEILRIKCKLALERNATRDYLDIAALTGRLGLARATDALARFGDIYPLDDGGSPVQQLAKQLASPRPYDLDATDLSDYKGLKAPLTNWNAVADLTKQLGLSVFARLKSRTRGRKPSSRSGQDGRDL